MPRTPVMLTCGRRSHCRGAGCRGSGCPGAGTGSGAVALALGCHRRAAPAGASRC
ncbi:hypothetical protein PLICRDRAFT_47188, partial [Plicaturopsis crispa FD-325 SS-3]